MNPLVNLGLVELEIVLLVVCIGRSKTDFLEPTLLPYLNKISNLIEYYIVNGKKPLILFTYFLGVTCLARSSTVLLLLLV